MLNTAYKETTRENISKPVGDGAAVIESGISLLHKGDHLFRMDDVLEGVYLLKVGAMKLYRLSKCGEQQITGFYLPGDVIGLDALNDGISKTGAIALDTTRVVFLPINLKLLY